MKVRKQWLLYITYGIVLFLALSNLGKLKNGLFYVLGILSPVILAIAVAFVVNLPLCFFEEKALAWLWKKNKRLAAHKRAISVVVTFVVILLVIALLITFIIPQLGESLKTLADSIPQYLDKAQKFMNEMMDKYNLSDKLWSKVTENWKEIINSASNFMSAAVPQIYNVTVGITGGITTAFMGIILSVYLLVSKEKMVLMVKKVMYAFLPKPFCDRVVYVGKKAKTVFQSFIGGQFTEAFILTVLCVVGLSLMRVPYALLISVLVGITSLVPIVGAWVGVATSCFLLLLVNPIKALWFVIFFIILQQVEGNLIYPRVVGNAIGVSGFWIIIAVTVGGSLFGVLGMLLGVPTISVIYFIGRQYVYKRLAQREIKIE